MNNSDTSRKPKTVNIPARQTKPNRRIRFHLFRWLTGLLTAALIWIFLASRLWTPKGDFSHLYDGVQGIFHLPAFILLPVLNVGALYVVTHRTLYEQRRFRALLLCESILYYAVLWGLNFLLTNQAENSPQPSNTALLGILGVPVLVIISTAIGIGPKPSTAKLEEKILPPTKSHTPSSEFGPNPITGLVRGVWALKRNWQAVVWGIAICTLISIASALVSPKMGFGAPKGASVSHSLLIFTLLSVGLAFAVQYYLLVIAVTTGRGQPISPKQAAARTLKLLPKLLLLEVIQGFAVFLGFLLFVVPGIILMFRFALARVVLIGENTSPITSLKFSSRLMKRNGMQVVGVWFLQSLVIGLAVAASFISHPWGNVFSTPISLAVATGLGIFLTRLNLELNRVKHAGFSRLRVHWLNIVILILWILLATIGIIAAVVYISIASQPQTSSTRTECYEVKVPTRFQVTKLSDCHLRAESKYVTLEYIPVVDSGTTLEQFVNNQRGTHFFNSSRYHQLPGVFGQSDVTVDSEDARQYSYTDTKTGGDVTAVFVHTAETFRVNGVQVRNFILVSTAKTDSASADWGEGMFTDVNLDLTASIVFPPYGTDEYKSDMQQVYDDLSREKYQEAADDAAAAAAAADNNKAKAAAFSLEANAQVQLNNLTAASTAFQEAYSLDSNNIDALDARANEAFTKGDSAGAIRYAMQVITQDDTYADAYNLLAVSYYAEGNTTLAKQNIQKVLALDPQNSLYQKNAAMILNSKLKPGKDNIQLPLLPV